MGKCGVLLVAMVISGCGDGGGNPGGTAGSTGTGTAGTGAGGTGTAGTGAGGTGASGWPMSIATEWVVQLNGATTPNCLGVMVATLNQTTQGAPISINGSWNCTEGPADCQYAMTLMPGWVCLSFSGPVTGTAQPGTGALSLSLNNGGNTIPVTGTMTASTMVGTAQFSNASIPFQADIR
jgi:hypothetical protein